MEKSFIKLYCTIISVITIVAADRIPFVFLRDAIYIMAGAIALTAGAVILAKLIEVLLKTAGSRTISHAIASSLRGVRSGVSSMAREMAQVIDSPIKHPKIKRICEYAFVVNGYFAAALYFLLFVGVAALVICAPSTVTFMGRMGGFLLSMACLYFAFALKALSDRDLLKLRRPPE